MIEEEDKNNYFAITHGILPGIHTAMKATPSSPKYFRNIQPDFSLMSRDEVASWIMNARFHREARPPSGIRWTDYSKLKPASTWIIGPSSKAGTVLENLFKDKEDDYRLVIHHASATHYAFPSLHWRHTYFYNPIMKRKHITGSDKQVATELAKQLLELARKSKSIDRFIAMLGHPYSNKPLRLT